MYKTTFIISVIFLFSFASLAQNQEYNHAHEDEHHHGHEIGASITPVYFANEAELSISTHLHYVYNFEHTKLGLGVGYERVFDEHKHNFIGVELNYRPVHRLTFSLSPGVVFEGDEKDFALHFETVYEFEFGAFHIGPVLELAWHPEDYHIGLGIHIGLGL